MKHERFLIAVLVCGLVAPVFAQDLSLPEPRKEGGMPLFEALAKRATGRSFDVKELSNEQISSLLWAAFGINRADGKRTAPSALNKQEIDLYVLLRSGAYVYEAGSNALRMVTTENLLKWGGTQDFVTNAPLTLVMVANLARMDGKDETSKLTTAYLDAGYVSQNVYLFCASESLATGARLSVDRKELTRRLKLRPSQVIVLGQSVGYAK